MDARVGGHGPDVTKNRHRASIATMRTYYDHERAYQMIVAVDGRQPRAPLHHRRRRTRPNLDQPIGHNLVRVARRAG